MRGKRLEEGNRWRGEGLDSREEGKRVTFASLSLVVWRHQSSPGHDMGQEGLARLAVAASFSDF